MICICCESPIGASDSNRINIDEFVCEGCVATGEALTQEVVHCELCGVESTIPLEEYEGMYIFICEPCLDKRS
jgi:hypothetical protein